jgi:hypothetical protein
MKRNLIAAIVGGIIMFAWQFVSFGLAHLHRPAMSYTEKQDAILSHLSQQQLPEGGYVLPNFPPGTSREEMEKSMDNMVGKPWAMIQYHNSMADDMMMSSIRSLLVNMIAVFLFCWLIRRSGVNWSFGSILGASVVTGLIIFLNVPYINFIWMKSFDVWASLLDAVVAWGLVGIWLGLYLRKSSGPTTVRVQRQEAELV